MRVVLTNLSNELYDTSRFRLNNSAKLFGISEIMSYDFKEIMNSSFYRENEEILNQPKGIGYWLWKPFIILEAMKVLSEGDIVVYADCGLEIIDHLEPLYTICSEQQPVLLFGNGDFTNSIWTKRDCFILMDCDHERFWNGPHCDAAFSLFRKSELSIQFLHDWLKYGADKRIITDLPNTCGQKNLPDFINHRWDQSVLSLLAQKNKLALFRMPSQFGNHYKTYPIRIPNEFNCINQLNQNPVNYYTIIPYYNSAYYQLLNHHRTKNSVSPVSARKSARLKAIVKKLRQKFGF